MIARKLNDGWRARSFRLVTIVTVGLLVTGLATPVAAAGEEDRRDRPQVSRTPSATVTPVGAAEVPLDQATERAAVRASKYADGHAQWPAAATWRTQLRGRVAEAASADSVMPVSVALPASAGRADVADLTVQMRGRQAAAALGVRGVVMTVDTTTSIDLTLNYEKFAAAYGGDFGSRLTLVAFPDCALTTPEEPGCADSTPLQTSNDVGADTLTTRVDPTLDAEKVGAEPMVIAALAEASSNAGTYDATTLSPSGQWEAGGSSGNFAWTYPMRTPPSLGGPAPNLTLQYSSQSVDGRTAGTNNQTSWVGEGFEFANNFIERRYVPCKTDGQGDKQDLCWKYDNAVLTLNGQVNELVKNGSTWRLRNDDGSRIQKLTNANVNNDNDKEYWKVTTPDGTQYVFGLHRLPGYASSVVTNSVWTVPVFGNNAGEPCYNKTGFASSWCQQAWRWNLDYVVDPRGNTMSYWYSPETNAYAKNGASTATVEYNRGGTLQRIDYGQTSSTMTSAAPMQVMFGTDQRCIPGAGQNCSTLNAANKADWPDVPFDLICAKDANCQNAGPSFFSRRRLTTVTTSVLSSGTTYQNVDRFTLDQSFPSPGDGTSPAMWLKSIQHDGLVGGSISLPPVTFIATNMANRVDTITDNYPALMKRRIRSVKSETGAVTTVTYSDAQCTPANAGNAASAAVQQANDKRCFPQRWTPPFSTPKWEWFHKYVVDAVSTADATGNSKSLYTQYQYFGTPGGVRTANSGAWHYADDTGLVRDVDKGWSQWRGYETVVTTQGNPVDDPDSQLGRTETTYFLGMNADKNGPTNRQVDGWLDDDPLAGTVRKEIVYSDTAGTEVYRTITDPWTKVTLTPSQSGAVAKAYFVRPARVETIEKVPGGSRSRVVTNSYDPTYGQLLQTSDTGDTSVGNDQSCVTQTYARNASTWLIDYVSRVETLSVACNATISRPADVLADTRTIYDGGTFGSSPTKGNPTTEQRVKDYTSGTPNYQNVEVKTFDVHGRVKTSTNAASEVTTTTYTPATGGPLKTLAVTSPAPQSFTTTTTLAPEWGAPTSVVDPNGKRTDITYDALGRRTAVWLPNRSKSAGASASTQYAYSVTDTATPWVRTRSLNGAGDGYITSVTLYDSLLRPRQSQRDSATGIGRVISTTEYDSRGFVTETDADVYNNSAPDTSLVYVAKGDVPARTENVLDGLGRVTSSTFMVNSVAKWTTTRTYLGDRVKASAPAGGTATTTFTDIRGNTSELWEWNGSLPDSGGHTTAKYKYDQLDRLVGLTDDAGASWSYKYDIMGRQIETIDPDTGTTTTTYTTLDQIQTTTDAEGRVLRTTYDTQGRKIGLYQGTAIDTTKMLSEWKYDTAQKGQLDQAIRYVGGQAGSAYKTVYSDYSATYQPGTVRVIIPAAEGSLAGTYTTTNGYRFDDSLDFTTLPGLGNLPAETVRYGYNAVNTPTTMGGTSNYVQDTVYTPLGDLQQLDLAKSATGDDLWITHEYETGTRQLTRTLGVAETIAEPVMNRYYSYDKAGNVTKISELATAVDDIQCFDYDGHRRLATAWTPGSGDCTLTPSEAALGGPAPYWMSWDYTTTGLRDLETNHATSPDSVSDYKYPSPTALRPHSLTSVDTTGPAGASSKGFQYDKTGNTTLRPGPSGLQTLEWDAEGNLTKLTEGQNVTTYLYGADGELLLRRGPTDSVLYLGSGELRLNRGTGTKSGVRNYAFAGQPVAVRRSSADLSWLLNDHQGTALVSVDAASQVATRRYMFPFGGVRTSGGVWPNDRTFLGKTSDETTGLVQVGARQYDPSIGRFISVDPLLDTVDPQSWAAYTYAANSPVSYADPSGLNKCASRCHVDDTPAPRPAPSAPQSNGSSTASDDSSDTTVSESNSSSSTTAEHYIQQVVAYFLQPIVDYFDASGGQQLKLRRESRAGLKSGNPARRAASSDALGRLAEPGWKYTGPRISPSTLRWISRANVALQAVAIPLTYYLEHEEAQEKFDAGTVEAHAYAATSTAAQTAGSFGGGYVGAAGGGTAGFFVAGPPGAVVGAIGGEVLGSVGGSFAADKVVETVWGWVS